MNTISIIILSLLVIIVGVGFLVYWATSSLYKHVEKKYAEFENNRSRFSDNELLQLKADIGLAMDQLDEMIKNQENFIGNTHSKSEYANSIDKAKQSLAENKNRRSRYEKMLHEIRYERSRREHARKYK